MSLRVNFRELMQSEGYKRVSECCATMASVTMVALTVITAFSLYIIGCVGVSGALSGSTMGWITVGLGGQIVAVNLVYGNLKTHKFHSIGLGLMASALVTVGALGAAGILSATQVGWGMVGTLLSATPMSFVVESGDRKL